MTEAERSKLEELQEKLEQGKTLHSLKPKEAEAMYKSIFGEEAGGDELNKVKEQAICKLGELYADQERVADIQKLMVEIRPFFNLIPKAKTAKIVRILIDLVAKVQGGQKAQLQLCLDTIEWCNAEKRTFLRHRIQCKLAQMYFEAKDYTAALDLVGSLLREVRIPAYPALLSKRPSKPRIPPPCVIILQHVWNRHPLPYTSSNLGGSQTKGVTRSSKMTHPTCRRDSPIFLCTYPLPPHNPLLQTLSPMIVCHRSRSSTTSRSWLRSTWLSRAHTTRSGTSPAARPRSPLPVPRPTLSTARHSSRRRSTHRWGDNSVHLFRAAA